MNQQVLDKINSLFNLPPFTYQGKATGGFLSDNYIVKSKKEKYFLKKYRSSVGNRLPVISKTEQFFSKRGIPIILPIKTKKGRTYFKVNGAYCALYPFVQGSTFNHNTDIPTRTLVRSIASNLARMHQHSQFGFPAYLNQQLVEWQSSHLLSKQARGDFFLYANRIVGVLNATKTKTEWDVLAEKTVKLKLAIATTAPSSFKKTKLGKPHIVHGDYHAQNLFVDSAGLVTHIYDLEKTGAKPRSLELVRSVLLICFSGYFTPQRFALARKYLAAYNEVYPIPKSQIEQSVRLLYYEHALSLWIEKGHYFNDYTRADVLLAGEYRYLKYMHAHLDTFIRRLLR